MPSLYRDRENVRQAERMHKIVQMRVIGFTYQQIADQLGCGVGTVRNAMKKYTEEKPRESVAEMRDLNAERIENLLPRHMQKGIKGDPRAAETARRLIDQHAKLTGQYQLEEDTGEKEAGENLGSFMDAVRAMAARELEADV